MSNNFIVGTYNKKKMRAVEIVFRGNVFFFNYLLLLKFRLNAEKAEKNMLQINCMIIIVFLFNNNPFCLARGPSI